MSSTKTGSTQEDRKLSQHDWKIADWDVKHQSKQQPKYIMQVQGSHPHQCLSPGTLLGRCITDLTPAHN